MEISEIEDLIGPYGFEIFRYDPLELATYDGRSMVTGDQAVTLLLNLIKQNKELHEDPPELPRKLKWWDGDDYQYIDYPKAAPDLQVGNRVFADKGWFIVHAVEVFLDKHYSEKIDSQVIIYEVRKG